MPTVDDNTIKPKREGYEYKENDRIHSFHERQVDFTGMKVDRMFFQQFEEKVKGLDKKSPVYVYCLAGVRSDKAADALIKKGFTKVVQLDGGIEAWKAASKPLE